MKQLSLLLIFFVTTIIAQAQFSTDAKTPLTISNAANSQHNVVAVDDTITSTGGYFVFWLDNRSNASNAELYGQRLDPDGNIQWESQGRFIAGSASTITGLAVTKWQQGLLLTYVIHSDSVMCMYLDSNGHNMWANPSVVARKQGSVIYLDAAGCLGVFSTTTGATLTYYTTFIGGIGAIGYNKIDFS